MKILKAAIAFAFLLSVPRPLHAQQRYPENYETVCPAGYTLSNLPGSNSFDPSTLKYRAVKCISPTTGKVVNPDTLSSSIFNVKNYGALGDTQKVTDGVKISSPSPGVSSATANFTQADVGKQIEVANGSSTGDALGVIVSVPNSTTALFPNGVNIPGNTGNSVIWGHDDTAAIQAAVSAMNSAASLGAGANNGLPGTASIYMPRGGYWISAPVFCIVNGCLTPVTGDGSEATILYLASNFNFGTESGNQGIVGNITGGKLQVDGNSFNNFTNPNADNVLNVGNIVKDVTVQFVSLPNSFAINSPSGELTNIFAQANGSSGATTGGVQLNSGSFECYNCEGSNNFGTNFSIVNVNGNGNTGSHAYIFGGLNDEGAQPSFSVASSTDVYIFGTKIFGQAGGTALNIDGTSVVHCIGCQLTPFATNANVTGVAIAAGGVFYASGSRILSTGTGVGINNSGTFFDQGGNSISSYSGAGTVFGSNSITGIAQTAAKIALTSGWSTSTVGTVSGSSLSERWTVTAAGTPAASPVITVTFPVAFFIAPLCNYQQEGGTFGVVTNPAITTTAGSMTLTFSGTPVATQTYTMNLTCSIP